MPADIVPIEPGVSRYAALAAALRARIVAGEWPAGTAIPAEQQLAAEHKVALGTMRRALELLVEQGLIERVHGRGTFVRQSLSGAPMLRFFRFGDSGEAPLSRILGRDRIAAPAPVARQLDIANGTECLRLKRLRLLGGQPCLYEEIWLPLPLFAALAKSDTAKWPDLLYPMFATKCGVHVHRARDEIGFGSLTAAQARQLALPAGHPCAIVNRTAYDLQGRAIEARTSRGDAHAFHYTVTIT
ncbi:GntR family transcriptional regulator [Ramlibacter albus]|uniref:GntR family transcriptional regulator n=1 Tax=Ramlibacter albus TaxID=2079448 RepID=A0A923S401_9BURK|nr:GntR family transcriptional regulator [Ramlibacter albus]MBC5766388.1 GntR family transcriptional regulator [Ramlibacter albus]